MTDDIDKKFEEITKKRRQKILKNDIAIKNFKKKELDSFREKYKKEAKKFKEVYSDIKKICSKFGDWHFSENDWNQVTEMHENTFILYPSSETAYITDGFEIMENIHLYDNHCCINTSFRGDDIEHFFGINIDKNCFKYIPDIKITYLDEKEKEKKFNSKEKFIKFFMTKVLDNLSDEEIKKYFK